MTSEAKTRAGAGLAAVITGVILIGTSGLTFAFGWVLWAVGLVVLLAAVPAAGGGRPPRGGKKARPARYSRVRWAASSTRRAARAARPSPRPSGAGRW